MAQHRGLDLDRLFIFQGPAVKGHHGADPVGMRSRGKGEGTAHTPANQTDLRVAHRLQAAQIGHRRLDFGDGPLAIQLHGQFARLVRLLRLFAMIEVGRQGHKPFPGEAFGHLLDMGHQPPPLLNHHNPRIIAVVIRPGQVTGDVDVSGREANHFCCNGTHLVSSSGEAAPKPPQVRAR